MKLRLSKLVPFHLFIVLFSICLFASCEQPVLESQACLEARDSIRTLYSIHMDGGANPSGAKVERLRPYVSKELFKTLSKIDKDSPDDLTQQTDFPKAFRAGACRDVNGAPEFDILLLWRNKERNIERKILVSTVKEDKWVVNSVRPAE